LATGLLYLDPLPQDLHGSLNTVKTPLNQLQEADLCPGSSVLDQINAALR
jgi:2-oxoglutarate ferredoxin oxidoreductase subunit beta